MPLELDELLELEELDELLELDELEDDDELEDELDDELEDELDEVGSSSPPPQDTTAPATMPINIINLSTTKALTILPPHYFLQSIATKSINQNKIYSSKKPTNQKQKPGAS